MQTRIMTVALLAALAQGCGGGGSNAGPSRLPTPTPVPICTQSLLFEGAGSVPSLVLVSQPISSATAGRLDVILDWTFADSPIGVYVVRGECSLDQFNARGCDFVLRSEPSTVKPRRRSVSGVAAGNYTLLVANFGERDESVSTQVFLKSEACPALASSGDDATLAAGPLARRLPY